MDYDQDGEAQQQQITHHIPPRDGAATGEESNDRIRSGSRTEAATLPLARHVLCSSEQIPLFRNVGMLRTLHVEGSKYG